LYTEEEFNAKVKELIGNMDIKEKITEDGEGKEEGKTEKETLGISESLDSGYADKLSITLTG